MHEMGIVVHLAKTLDEMAAQKKLTKIARVTLQVGEVSGIVTALFTDAWEYFKKKNAILKDCTLVMETIPAVTWCDNCRKTYETVKYGRKCPYCHLDETWLLQGNECIIKEIEAE